MESIEKLKSLRGAMAKQSIDAVFLSNLDDVRWLTGFSGSSGYALVSQDKARFLSDSRYTVQSAEEVSNMTSYTFGSPVTFEEFLKAQVNEMGLGQLWFDADEVTVARFNRLELALPGVKLEPFSGITKALRMVKTESEILAARRACALADACYDHICRLIQPGSIEFDLGLEIEFFFRRHGAELAFDPIVVSGLRSARPHGHPSENRLQEGDFVTMDFGAKLDGFCSDITRTIVVSNASDRHRDVYNRVLAAQNAAIQAIKPGALAKDVDAIARENLGDLAPYFGHGLGHGLGAIVHDLGRLGPASTEVIEENQIWTIEPGVYIEGFGGVRIEDDVLVTANGCEVLTHSPKDLTILP